MLVLQCSYLFRVCILPSPPLLSSSLVCVCVQLTDDKQAEAGKNVLAEMAAKSAESGRRLMAGAHRDVPDDDEEEEVILNVHVHVAVELAKR